MSIQRRFIFTTVLILSTALLASVLITRTADAQTPGSLCRSDSGCNAGLRCADGRRCAPVDGTGAAGAYCHHDNHCVTKRCDCDHGNFGFCKDWERWPPGQFGGSGAQLRIGFCTGKQANGGPCRGNAQCTSGYCADGQRCAPRDGTGRSGDYCHHNNHCRPNSQCICPAGQSFGFCANWESFSFVVAQNLNRAGTSFFCR